MPTLDWRRLVDETIAQHALGLRSHLKEEESRRRQQAGGELRYLTTWLRTRMAALEAGSPALEAPRKEDSPWVARVKLQLRQASAIEAQRGRSRGFARALRDHVVRWEARASELLAGATPPPMPADATTFKAPELPSGAATVPAPTLPAPPKPPPPRSLGGAPVPAVAAPAPDRKSPPVEEPPRKAPEPPRQEPPPRAPEPPRQEPPPKPEPPRGDPPRPPAPPPQDAAGGKKKGKKGR